MGSGDPSGSPLHLSQPGSPGVSSAPPLASPKAPSRPRLPSSIPLAEPRGAGGGASRQRAGSRERRLLGERSAADSPPLPLGRGQAWQRACEHGERGAAVTMPGGAGAARLCLLALALQLLRPRAARELGWTRSKWRGVGGDGGGWAAWLRDLGVSPVPGASGPRFLLPLATPRGLRLGRPKPRIPGFVSTWCPPGGSGDGETWS